MSDTFSNDLSILGQALETAWAAERAAPFGDPADAAATVTRVIADQIAALPARSVADLIVKARAVAWRYNGDVDQIRRDWVGEHCALDGLLFSSIVIGLLQAGSQHGPATASAA